MPSGRFIIGEGCCQILTRSFIESVMLIEHPFLLNMALMSLMLVRDRYGIR